MIPLHAAQSNLDESEYVLISRIIQLPLDELLRYRKPVLVQDVYADFSERKGMMHDPADKMSVPFRRASAVPRELAGLQSNPETQALVMMIIFPQSLYQCP
jgi:hypothetical protein